MPISAQNVKRTAAQHVGAGSMRQSFLILYLSVFYYYVLYLYVLQVMRWCVLRAVNSRPMILSLATTAPPTSVRRISIIISFCGFDWFIRYKRYKYKLRRMKGTYKSSISKRESSYCFQRVLAIAILSVRLSVRLSVTRVDQSKTVQDRITKFLLSAAWKTLVSGTVKLFW